MGRSIRRAVRVAFSPARPSRLKNEPGIFPAAYIRSSTSTVKGRKSTSRRLPAVAVQRTIVSPVRITTAPEACLANLPVSNEISLPAISADTRVTASDIFNSLLLSPPFGRRSASFSYSFRTQTMLAGPGAAESRNRVTGPGCGRGLTPKAAGCVRPPKEPRRPGACSRQTEPGEPGCVQPANGTRGARVRAAGYRTRGGGVRLRTQTDHPVRL